MPQTLYKGHPKPQKVSEAAIIGLIGGAISKRHNRAEKLYTRKLSLNQPIMNEASVAPYKKTCYDALEPHCAGLDIQAKNVRVQDHRNA